MQVIRDSSGFVGQWVADHSASVVPDGSMSFGFIDDKGRLAGGVSLSNRDDRSCSVTIAATNPRWCVPGILHEMFKTVFDDLGVQYLYTLTPQSNERAKKLAVGLGFRPDGLLRRVGPGGDDVNLFGMLREDCKFLKLEMS